MKCVYVSKGMSRYYYPIYALYTSIYTFNIYRNHVGMIIHDRVIYPSEVLALAFE